MNVKTLTLVDFMNHRHSTVDLPDAGLVLVTGENGAGKSSFMEAVAWGLWGKTLRGTNPAPCTVVVETDAVSATRSKPARGKSRLDWHLPGAAPVEFENQTKAQAALTEVIGPFEVWRRTAVFSSQDAAHFTMAPDSERKRLLEHILGLDKFDIALASARADLKASMAEEAAAQRELESLRLRLSAAERRLSDAEEGLAGLQPAQPSAAAEAELEALRVQSRAAKQVLAERQEAYNAAMRQVAALEADERRLRAELAHLQDDACPTCGQVWPDAESRATARDKLLQKLASLEVEEARVALGAQATQKKSAEAELATIQEQGQALKRALATQTATAGEAARLRRLGQEAMDEVERLEGELAVAMGAALTAGANAAALRACERALGMRGVRAHVLAAALAGIEDVANGWLARLSRDDAPLSIKLSPYTEKKAGGVVDSLSLDVVGAAGGTGYRGASGGERRRVDVALLLALAEVASSAYGRERGTLFFDEVFDSLDRRGTEAVTSALSELAQDRAVVVISHSPDLIDLIEATTWLTVGHGKVQRA